ncbi:MAG: prolyl oligopeptidase family serine peptidase [Candidatus Accumulibacter sp.]|nr:prolyl oligopeptidase family serine peptidase [Accumulibacter sp.]
MHGLGADKELHRSDLQRFAAAGLLAIGVDAVGHGQRRLPDFEQQFAQPPAQRERLFNTLVAQTVAELPGLLDALVDGGLSDPQRLAVAGVSMGGCITYGAVSRDRRFRAAVALLGSPAGLFAARRRCCRGALLPDGLAFDYRRE